MVYVVVCAVALAASVLTLFSGFGLGTLLLPAFLLFFPADEAVALTGIVHLMNNVFKLGLLGRHADRSAVLRFGIPAILGSLAGAWLLVEASALPPLASYLLFGIPVTITPVKTLMGGLITFFAILEGRSWKKGADGDGKPAEGGLGRDEASRVDGTERVDRASRVDGTARESGHLALGGLISGFFGGLSGHQGAFRSVFLLRAGLSREVFLGTGVVLACLVDLTRLGVYARHFTLAGLQANAGILAAAGVAALTGALIGANLVKKSSMAAIRKIVTALLMLVGVLLLLGVL